jgi:hypothetical protein
MQQPAQSINYSQQQSTNSQASNSSSNNSNGYTLNPNSNSNATNTNVPNPIIRKRRDAFRLLKVHESNGHEFIAKFFSQFTFCSFCAEFLW